MRITGKRVAIGAGLGALVLTVAPLVAELGPVAHAACPNNSQNVDANGNPTTNYVAGDQAGGGVYTSGGDPTGGSGYIGAAGANPADNSWGYVEAGGTAGAPPSGYITTSSGGVYGC